jgi:hypothetical protein
MTGLQVLSTRYTFKSNGLRKFLRNLIEPMFWLLSHFFASTLLKSVSNAELITRYNFRMLSRSAMPPKTNYWVGSFQELVVEAVKRERVED